MKKIFYFVFLFFLIQSCDKNEKSELAFTRAHVSETDEINDIYFADDQRGFAFGGSYWQHAALLTTTDGGRNWRRDTFNNFSMLQRHHVDLEGNVRVVSNAANWLIKRPTDSSFQLASMPLGSLMSDLAFSERGKGVVVGGQAQFKGWSWRVENGWQVVKTDTFAHQLNAIFQTSDKNLHAVGYGVILKSTDRGNNWEENAIRSDDNLVSVFFLDNLIGFSVGNHGTILKTTDGGENWTKIKNGDSFVGSAQPFTNVFFKNANEGYVVGERGLFWKTTDGGMNWTEFTNLPPDFTIQKIYFQGQTGWLVGRTGRGKGLILRFSE